ncbi:uncharacterized protein KD926_006810 [Aspergillus affinis]|uniref:uncharacterized protein n=1 Tax=Aspergillus affinis TaxID=1070780 RepID=UPI0022FF403A|nr:uncharacterized protein KD926_006810 [Aspergillus affinis]KAI9041414.1 hypothetical protein KD926_006810 [Aspergillus affinis]
MFRRLRSISQDEGAPIGGICGEGAKELRVDECALFQGITTSHAYSDLQFSARHHGSKSYVKYLRSPLAHEYPTLGHGSIFTHGDIRPANIMVKEEPDAGGYTITRIIDWENSGFYPPYSECTALTRTLSVTDDDDWFSYLPASVGPSQFPIRWLVDRLWQTHLKTIVSSWV